MDRRTLATFAATCACLAASAAGAGCSSGAPVGGPHGNEGALVAPNGGNSSSSSSSTTAASSASSTGATSGGVADASIEGGSVGPGGPTFTAIFNAYLTGCKMCHTQTQSSRATYLWLRSQGYITGASPALVDSAQSCLSWYGGNMPPGGGDNATAVADMNAWAAAGALDN